MENKEKEIPIEDYEHCNRNGFPCTLSWKYRLIKIEEQGGTKAPFKWVKRQTKTFVIVKNN